MATVTIPVQFEVDPQAPIELNVVIADAKGNILQTTSIDSGGKINLDNALLQRTALQVAVMPNLDEQMEGIKNLSQLSRQKPYIASLGWDAKKKPFFKPVPSIYLGWWHIKTCRVVGRVTKKYLINNVSTVLPVCHAKVHICEVDKISWILPRIPDHIILRIPDLIEKIPPINPVIVNPVSPVIVRPNINIRPNVFTPKAVPVIKLEPSIAARFDTTNPQIIRAEIANNFTLLRPYFCKLPWLWPYFYRCDEIRNAITDENGRFDVPIKYSSLGDKPDIYIWVECFINGSWTTVYRPSIACNTWWDYACGTDININVTDDRVKPTCGSPLPGQAVWIRRIGSRTIRDVLQTSNNAPIQGVPFERRGLFLYGGDHRSPFATTSQSARMDFEVIFGSGLPSSTAKYFRWACRKIANEEMVTELSPVVYLQNPVSRPYLVEYTIGSITHFRVDSAPLGPVSIGASHGLFHIPPPNPVGFGGVTSSVGWMSMSVDTTSLDTRTLHGDGLYKFWLEIFDASGNQVSPAPSFFTIPKAGNFDENEVAAGDYAEVEDGRNLFTMVVRIDSLNNKTVAEIYPVKLTGPGGMFTVSNPCGFLDFTDEHAKNISIPFKAFQPKNFADFSFSVGRGNAGTGAAPTVAGVSGMVIGNAGRYVRDANGVYTPDDSPDLELSPAELMQTCLAGGRAAFTQNLRVDALHTDGYRILDELDSSATAAFALSKK